MPEIASAISEQLKNHKYLTVKHTTSLFDWGFLTIAKKLRDIIRKLFDANLFNYAFLGNETRHLHMHLVPRYSHKVKIGDFVFEDKRWNKNYVPYDKNYKLPDGAKKKIIGLVKRNL